MCNVIQNKYHNYSYNFPVEIGNLYIDENSCEVVMMVTEPDDDNMFKCIVIIAEDCLAPQMGSLVNYDMGCFTYYNGALTLENDKI